jgi:membrane dipeptidase
MNLNRRTLLGTGTVTLVAAMTQMPALAQGKSTAEKIYRGSIALDTLMSSPASFDEKPALAAGLTGGCIDLVAYPRNKWTATEEIENWDAAFADPSRKLYPVLAADDFAKAKEAGRFAVVLVSQDASIFGTNSASNGSANISENVRLFYKLGLRLVLVTYTDANGLGDGYNEPSNGGLKNEAHVIIPEMNKLGMIVDVSHSGERTSLEAIALSIKPCSISHAGCYALYPNLRNKSDKVIRAVADKGGYFGVYNMTLWMTSKDTASVDDIVDHIDHVVKIGGIDTAGFGSDHPVNGDPTGQAEQLSHLVPFVEINKGKPAGAPINGHHVTASDMDGPDRLLVLARALEKRGYKSGEIEKILGANFVRVFREVCG